MTIYTSKKFYSEVLSAKISPHEEEPVFQEQEGTWPFESKSPGEPLCRSCTSPVPLFCRCAKSGLFLLRGASQGGGGELLHPPLCQDGGFDGFQLRAWLGAVQGRVCGSHGALERGTGMESLRCRRAASDSWLHKTGEQSSHTHKASQKHLSYFFNSPSCTDMLLKNLPFLFSPNPQLVCSACPGSHLFKLPS